MQIIVEGQSIDIDLPRENVELREVVEEVETFLLSVGKVPVALNIDGHELSQTELEAREKDPLSGNEVIHFGVKTVFDFVLEHVEGASQANQELLKHIPIFAEEIHQTEKTVDPVNLINEINHFFDFWYRMQQLLPHFFQEVHFSDKTLQEILDSIRQVLQEAKDAMERDDFVLAGDLLTYEVVPLIENVDGGLPFLIERIKVAQEA